MAVDTRLLERLERKLDLSRSQVNRRITERSRDGFLTREQAAIALALEVGASVAHVATPDDFAAIRQAATRRAPEPAAIAAVTPRASRARPRRRVSGSRSARSTKRKGKKVLVVHGRDQARRTSMFRLLRALGLEPIEWSKALSATKKAAPYIGEVLDQAFKEAVAVVVLLTPDDQARLKKQFRKRTEPAYEMQLTGQARANVLFEAGMAFGRHPDSTVLVEVGDLRPFSDVGGRHVIRLTDRAESRKELANRLEVAGCEVDTEGEDWLSEGSVQLVDALYRRSLQVCTQPQSRPR